MKAVILLLLIVTLASVQSVDKLQLSNVRAEAMTYKGKAAIHITQTANAAAVESFAAITGSQFKDGTIEVDLAGAPAANSGEGARGFIGIAFRMASDSKKFELLYLRPTNGRADDQLRRNHSTQYVSFPEWPWERTRKETPGVYESYTDLQPAEWTKMKIVVSGAKARLYVNGAEQPCLIVNDLKLTPVKGGIALWIGPGTDGYFANLRITQ